VSNGRAAHAAANAPDPPAAGPARRADVTFFNPFGEAVAKSFRVPEGEALAPVGGDVSVQNRTLLQAFGDRYRPSISAARSPYSGK